MVDSEQHREKNSSNTGKRKRTRKNMMSSVHYFAQVVCIAVGFVSVVREATQGAAAAAADHDETSLPQLTQEGPLFNRVTFCLSFEKVLLQP